MIKAIHWLLAVVLLAVLALPAWSQDRGRGDRGNRGGGGGGGDRRNQWMEQMIGRMDTNQNGQLDPEESQGRARPFIERMAQDNGFDLAQPIKLDELRQRMTERANRGQGDGQPGSQGGNPQPGTATPAAQGAEQKAAAVAPTPLVPTFGAAVPGFGEATITFGTVIASSTRRPTAPTPAAATVTTPAAAAAPGGGGFGSAIGNFLMSAMDPSGGMGMGGLGNMGGSMFPSGAFSPTSPSAAPVPSTSAAAAPTPTATPAASSTPAAAPTPPSPPRSVDERTRTYVQGLMKKYDTDQSGALQESEWGEMSSMQRGADANGDKSITEEELLAHNSPKGSAPASPQSAGVASARPKVSSGPRKTYRFLLPSERLPAGLPDWFSRSDTDGDGQVRMNEYALSWTRDKAAEFARYDLDQDGVVTPREALGGR